MNALIRAALVGAVVGLAQAVIAFHGPEDAAGNLLLMLFAPLPAGMLLSWYAMLRNWWLVALLGQFALVALYVGLTMTAPFSALLAFGAWRVGLITMAAGACGYALGAGIALPVATPLRLSAVGVAASLFLAAWSNHDVTTLAAQAQAMAARNATNVVPDLPGFRLTEVENHHPDLSLTYERADAATVVVDVLPETVPPEHACEEAIAIPRQMTCTEAAKNIWVLSDDYGRAVFTAHGNTLVRLSSGTVPEKQLLAAARALRPVGLWELAAPAYERP
ncbi:hypothetical protein ACIBQ6_21010 [Nonomuraea sp. NPDC049655]|uniref:hypothetical protein n=1 Tax=Nonomuraea sp. NPDC049655 TaxID=3364355 RepID=UPI00379E82DD